MKRLAYSSSFAGISLFATVALSGCGGSMSMPDTNIDSPATQVKIQPIQGSNFGGHAPIAGAEVFILQAGTGGYSEASTNLCDVASCQGDANYGAYATKTAADGTFGVSGDYSCTSGYPVYLVAVGGYASPDQGSGGSSTITLTAATVTSTSFSFSTFKWTNTITFTGNNLLYPGEQVTLANLTNGPGGANWPAADGVQTVISATTTTFVVQALSAGTLDYPTFGAITNPFGSGTATVSNPSSTGNPAIINVALLGNCPSGTQKNFGSSSNDPISYVYMNEVSTAATAFALSGFGSDAFHIGVPLGDSLALTNIENATNNATQLYSIEGANSSGTSDGEGHIANYYTPGSFISGVRSSTNYGIVDQAKLDTVGNILASCVDSDNTYGKGYTGTGTVIGANCKALFDNATSTGVLSTSNPGTGIVPWDIATAAFNIAHHPSGAAAASGSFGGNLVALQGTVYPFSPATTTVDDFTIGITYYAEGINSPQGIAIDAIGDAWITNHYQDPNATSGHYLVGLNPLGVPLTNSPFDVPGARTAAIDNSGNVWATNQAANFYKVPVTTPGVYSGTVDSFTFNKGTSSSFGIAIDGSGNLDLTSYGSTGIYHYTGSTGAYVSTYAGCGKNAVYVTLAEGAAGDIWTDSDLTAGYVCENASTGGNLKQSADYTAGTATQNLGPNPFAVDANGAAWVPVYETASGATPAASTTDGALIEITSGGTATSITTGGLNGPSASAIDGGGNIWVANKGATTGIPTVSEFTSAGVALTGTDAYRYGDTVPGSNFAGANVAIDGSGDVWLAFNGASSGSSVTAVELIGAAVPTVTPLVTNTVNSDIGNVP
jgi:hypothetical protein